MVVLFDGCIVIVIQHSTTQHTTIQQYNNTINGKNSYR